MKSDPARHGDWECRGGGVIRETKGTIGRWYRERGKRSERNGDVSSLSALIVTKKRDIPGTGGAASVRAEEQNGEAPDRYTNL